LCLGGVSGPTCEGDLGRGGPGDIGLSVWLGLAAGLLSGLSSSGGVGVLANRRGPESLSTHTHKLHEHYLTIHYDFFNSE